MSNPYLMIDIEGVVLTEPERRWIQHPSVAGVILFRRNYQNKSQLLQLVQSLRTIKPELILAVDHEGGRVQRFITEFSRIPTMKSIGDYYQADQNSALKAAEAIGYLHAVELIECGFDLSFSPVLDIDTGVSSVIGDRSFGNTAKQVTRLGSAWIQGMKLAGMPAVAKHFPGHGHVELDSHLNLPTDPRKYTEILQSDLIPFIQLKNDYTAIMTAHILFPKVDDKPCTLSEVWLKEILQQQLGFTGTIITDDLGMGAMKEWGPVEANIEMAIKAGSDLIILCNNIDLTQAALAHPWLADLTDQDNRYHQQRLQRLRAQQTPLNSSLIQLDKQFIQTIEAPPC